MPTTAELEAALLVAADPAATEQDLLDLPLRALPVWSAVAARRRMPRSVRARLVEIAMSGPYEIARRNQPQWGDYEQRWALAVLAVRWLSPARLRLLATQLARVCRNAPAPEAAAIATALVGHPGATLPVLGVFLDRLGPVHSPTQVGARRAVQEVFASAGAAHAVLALLDERVRGLAGGGRPCPVVRDLRATVGPAKAVGERLDGLGERPARVVREQLAAWPGDLAGLVAAAPGLVGLSAGERDVLDRMLPTWRGEPAELGATVRAVAAAAPPAG